MTGGEGGTIRDVAVSRRKGLLRTSGVSIRRRLVDALPAQIAVPLGARFGHRDPEIEFLSRFVNLGDTVVDVGAHKGAYAWHLSRLVGTSGCVHAFEPQPELAERLQAGLSHTVQVHAQGLSDDERVSSLTVPIWGSREMLGHATLEPVDPATRRRSMNVDLITLDSLSLRPSFLKVDVEGHELAVLQGGEATIDAARPTLLLEIDYRRSQHTRQRASLLAWLKSHDYRAYHVAGDDLIEIGTLRPDHDPNEGFRSSPYVYNWFMIPA